ncbi:MAG: acyl-CoA dehydrogenase family protein [Alphaproteobacteria bacterium]|jgi:acyl-CoA dehydrogenase
MDHPVSETEFAQFLETIRRFTREKLIPAEREVDETGEIPSDIVDQMRELGLFGMTLPQKYGGLALSMEQQVRATFEFTQAAAIFRSRFSTTLGLSSQAVYFNGAPEQCDAYLPKMASGEITASFALTEPGAGSDAGGIATRARRDGDEYVLNGEKCFITNAPEADLFVVMARSDANSSGSSGISAFLVEAGTPGLSVGRTDRKMGQHGSHTSNVFFDECRIPRSALLGHEEGAGFKNAMAGINTARMHVAATCVGQALRLIDEAVNYALHREQFGKPIADFQSIRNMLANSRAETLAAKSMTLDVARRIDNGEQPLGDMSCCKMFASEMVCRVADNAVQILGGAGYMNDHVICRMYQDVRLFRIFEGTSQIHQLIISREMLKEASAD